MSYIKFKNIFKNIFEIREIALENYGERTDFKVMNAVPSQENIIC